MQKSNRVKNYLGGEYMKKKQITACVISSYAYIDEYINYGALMQYFALEKALLRFGTQSYWLRYKFSNNSIKKRVKKIIKKCICYKTEADYSKTLLSFKRFIENYCNVSDRIYTSETDLQGELPQADVYITGSDQVWGGMFAPNYLTFVPDIKLKVSYAASFGKDVISDEHYNTVKPWITRLNFVSVRETSGVTICNKMGINATQVLDPTLLIDSSDYPIIDEHGSPDVYCYFLNFDTLDDLQWREIISFVNNSEFSLKVACTNQTYTKYPSQYRDLPSPEEWLSRYFNSKYILTNTFHGTVFAIIFHRPFLVIKQKGEGAKQNGRVESLLASLNLQDRYYNDEMSIEDQIKNSINWSDVDSRILNLRKASYKFIEEFITSMEL